MIARVGKADEVFDGGAHTKTSDHPKHDAHKPTVYTLLSISRGQTAWFPCLGAQWILWDRAAAVSAAPLGPPHKSDHVNTLVGLVGFVYATLNGAARELQPQLRQ